MRLDDFRVGLRLLLKEPGYSLVAVLGLAVGLAVCLLLLGYARYSWQYNSYVPDAAHVYVVKERRNTDLGAPWSDHAPVLLRAVASKTAGVTAASGYLTWWPLTITVNGTPYKLKGLTALPGFPEMIGLQAIAGDLQEALSRPDAIALTRSAAIRLFGTPDVVGRTALLKIVDDGSPENPKNTGIVRIAAMLPDRPSNTTIPFEVLHGPKLTMIAPWMGMEALVGDHGFPGNLLLRVRPDASLPAITEALQHAVDEAPALQPSAGAKEGLHGRRAYEIKLSPLRDAYFDGEVEDDFLSAPVDRGNVAVVKGLVAVGLLMLALAAINYVNLTTIRVIRRQHEIAMRRVLGAKGGGLAWQFIAESLVVSMLATGIALGLAWLALPIFGKLMNRDLASVFDLVNVAIAVSLGLVLGLLTAIYPTWIAIGVHPSRIIAGRPSSESASSRRLRRMLSVLQVAVAMGLAGYTMSIYWQTRFAIGASPGFDPSPLLMLEFPDAITFGKTEHARQFMAALSSQREIAGVAVSNNAVGRNKDSWSLEVSREGGPVATLKVQGVSAAFFEQYGIRPVAGRLFDPRIDREEDPVPTVINVVAARELGFASPQLAVGQTLLSRSGTNGDSGAASSAKRIIGIAPEIRYGSLREAPRAVAYQLFMRDVFLTVRASGSSADAERAVRRLWIQYFPNDPLELTPAKEIYAANYADDARLARVLAIATLVALIIAAGGAYVLAADVVQRRTGEIAMHKLFGAQRADIGKLVVLELGSIVLMGAAIGLPVAALGIAHYLAPYTSHAPPAYWSLALAPVAAVLVMGLAAARHAWIAMDLKPAVALRSD
jgi:putative ABC transport system permease protein